MHVYTENELREVAEKFAKTILGADQGCDKLELFNKTVNSMELVGVQLRVPRTPPSEIRPIIYAAQGGQYVEDLVLLKLDSVYPRILAQRFPHPAQWARPEALALLHVALHRHEFFKDPEMRWNLKRWMNMLYGKILQGDPIILDEDAHGIPSLVAVEASAMMLGLANMVGHDNVLYMDTDMMIARNQPRTKEQAAAYVSAIGMSMNFELGDRLLLIGKKNYMLTRDGIVISKSGKLHPPVGVIAPVATPI